MLGTKTESRHKWQCGVVVEEVHAHGRSWVRIPSAVLTRILREKCRRWAGTDRWGPPPIKKNFHFFPFSPIFSGFFFGSNFAECRALGKGFAAFAECKLGFAECPWHSAKPLSPVVVKVSWFFMRDVYICLFEYYYCICQHSETAVGAVLLGLAEYVLQVVYAS